MFVLITHYKLKGGLFPYVKGFFEPVFIFAPFNIISGEVATPVSDVLRHYGNVLSGMVISTLVAYALQTLSHMLLGWLPGVLGQFPFLQVGLPGHPVPVLRYLQRVDASIYILPCSPQSTYPHRFPAGGT